MLYYVARPTNVRSLTACHEHGFGALLSPLSVNSSGKVVDISNHVWPSGLRYSFDNGAWACRNDPSAWRPDPLLNMVARLGLSEPGGYYREGLGRGFMVLPDVVGDGRASIGRSLDFLQEHRGGDLSDMVVNWLLAVQDGMAPDQVRPIVERHHLGIFVGGSTAWKWETVHEWARLALEIPHLYLHVGRVNTLRRAELCRDLGVHSCDGSSVTRFSVNAAKMARAHDGDDRTIPVLVDRHGRDNYAKSADRERATSMRRIAEATIAHREFYLALGGAV